MVKQYLNPSEWSGALDKVDNAKNAVDTFTPSKTTKTTMSCFTKLSESEQKLHDLVDRCKQMVADDVWKMRNVADKIVDEDKKVGAKKK